MKVPVLRVFDNYGNEVPIPAIVGPQGPEGPAGPAGTNYVLTAADKEEIAAAVLSALPAAEEVSF